MANFLNNYDQKIVTASDYLKILRLYTQQHYLPDGKINLVENYDPNLGGPIVYYYWSNHYNHSSYNNLVITGLCGLRPSETDTLVINPLIDNSIQYFCLDEVLYHGHKLIVVYDRDGTRYKMGKIFRIKGILHHSLPSIRPRILRFTRQSMEGPGIFLRSLTSGARLDQHQKQIGSLSILGSQEKFQV